ncbi:MAG TPA: antibiotic biosynthesis monooxygenase [Solirubrobacteraceae bacterium]|jgi:heme-degrading monooxygenase HmoA|nr:antibiotic biosynthesis monooxygenase [Solirubrobacteraceae bacterium]
MHARMTLIEGSGDRLDEVVGQVESDVLPLLRGQSGFKGFTVMGDRSSGRVVAVSYWNSEDDMRASEEAVRESRERAAEAVGATGGPRVEHYEVLIDVEE